MTCNLLQIEQKERGARELRLNQDCGSHLFAPHQKIQTVLSESVQMETTIHGMVVKFDPLSEMTLKAKQTLVFKPKNKKKELRVCTTREL